MIKIWIPLLYIYYIYYTYYIFIYSKVTQPFSDDTWQPRSSWGWGLSSSNVRLNKFVIRDEILLFQLILITYSFSDRFTDFVSLLLILDPHHPLKWMKIFLIQMRQVFQCEYHLQYIDVWNLIYFIVYQDIFIVSSNYVFF